MEKSTYIGIGIFVLVVVGGILFIGSNKDSGSNAVPGGNVREITIDVKRFDFTPGTINVEQGETVRLRMNNMDTTHGIKIPELGVSGNDVVEFTASNKGSYTFYCNNYCGEGHSAMSGIIVVN